MAAGVKRGHWGQCRCTGEEARDAAQNVAGRRGRKRQYLACGLAQRGGAFSGRRRGSVRAGAGGSRVRTASEEAVQDRAKWVCERVPGVVCGQELCGEVSCCLSSDCAGSSLDLRCC